MEDSGKMPHKSFSAETTSKSSLPSQCVGFFSEEEFFFFDPECLKKNIIVIHITKNKDFFGETRVGILYKKVFYSIMPSEAFPSRR
jgi:hypothetical protein